MISKNMGDIAQVDITFEQYCRDYTNQTYNHDSEFGRFKTYILDQQLSDFPIEKQLGAGCQPQNCIYFIDQLSIIHFIKFPIPEWAAVEKHESKELFVFYVLQYCYNHQHPPSSFYVQKEILPKINVMMKPLFLEDFTETSYDGAWDVLTMKLNELNHHQWDWSRIMHHCITNEVGIEEIRSSCSADMEPQQEEALKEAIADVMQLKRTNEIVVHEDEKEHIEDRYTTMKRMTEAIFGDEFEAETLIESFMCYGINEILEIYDAAVRIIWEFINDDRFDVFTDTNTSKCFIARCNVFCRYFIQHRVFPEISAFHALPIAIIYSRFLTPIPFFAKILSAEKDLHSASSSLEECANDNDGDEKNNSNNQASKPSPAKVLPDNNQNMDLRALQCMLIAFGVSLKKKFNSKNTTRFTAAFVVDHLRPNPKIEWQSTQCFIISVIHDFITIFDEKFGSDEFNNNINVNNMAIITVTDDMNDVNIEYEEGRTLNDADNNWLDRAQVYKFFNRKQVSGLVMQRFGFQTNINDNAIKTYWHHHDTYTPIALADICRRKWAIALTSSLSVNRLNEDDIAWLEYNYTLNTDNELAKRLKAFVFHNSYLKPVEVIQNGEEVMDPLLFPENVEVSISDKSIAGLSGVVPISFYGKGELRSYVYGRIIEGIKQHKIKRIDNNTAVFNLYQNHKDVLLVGRLKLLQMQESHKQDECHFGGNAKEDSNNEEVKPLSTKAFADVIDVRASQKTETNEWYFDGIHETDTIDEDLMYAKDFINDEYYIIDLNEFVEDATDISDDAFSTSSDSSSSSLLHPAEAQLKALLLQRNAFSPQNWRAAIQRAQEPERRVNYGQNDDDRKEIDPRNHYLLLPMNVEVNNDDRGAIVLRDHYRSLAINVEMDNDDDVDSDEASQHSISFQSAPLSPPPWE